MPVLECKRVTLFSELDEQAFTDWLDRIKAIRRWEGVDDTLYLHVNKRLSNAALRDLLALFFRYEIAMKQLAQFETAANREWFAAPQMYWHKRVFAGKKRK